VSRDGDINSLKLFLKANVKAEQSDVYNQTPLFYAAREGHLEIANCLIDNGADVNHVDVAGQTPLFYAS
jgi:ankyrin repeat protein